MASSLKPGKLCIGDRVLIGDVKAGKLLYIGKTQFAPGEWCGIELEDRDGKHDGKIHGIRYFTCRQDHGIFAPVHKVQAIKASKRESPSDEEGPDKAIKLRKVQEKDYSKSNLPTPKSRLVKPKVSRHKSDSHHKSEKSLRFLPARRSHNNSESSDKLVSDDNVDSDSSSLDIKGVLSDHSNEMNSVDEVNNVEQETNKAETTGSHETHYRVQKENVRTVGSAPDPKETFTTEHSQQNENNEIRNIDKSNPAKQSETEETLKERTEQNENVETVKDKAEQGEHIEGDAEDEVEENVKDDVNIKQENCDITGTEAGNNQNVEENQDKSQEKEETEKSFKENIDTGICIEKANTKSDEQEEQTDANLQEKAIDKEEDSDVKEEEFIENEEPLIDLQDSGLDLMTSITSTDSIPAGLPPPDKLTASVESGYLENAEHKTQEETKTPTEGKETVKVTSDVDDLDNKVEQLDLNGFEKVCVKEDLKGFEKLEGKEELNQIEKLDLKQNLNEFEKLDFKGKHEMFISGEAPCVESQIEATTCVVVGSQITNDDALQEIFSEKVSSTAVTITEDGITKKEAEITIESLGKDGDIINDSLTEGDRSTNKENMVFLDLDSIAPLKSESQDGQGMDLSMDSIELLSKLDEASTSDATLRADLEAGHSRNERPVSMVSCCSADTGIVSDVGVRGEPKERPLSLISTTSIDTGKNEIIITASTYLNCFWNNSSNSYEQA